MRVFASVVIFGVIAGVVSKCEADVMIQPVAVSTDMGAVGGTDINNIIDQSGLDPGYVSGVTDASSYSATATGDNDTYWLSETATGFVTFDLGVSLPLQDFRFWNTGAAAGGGFTNVVDFTLFSDGDSDPTNGGMQDLGSFVASTESFDMQVFEIDATTQFVHMEIVSNGESSYSGVKEVAFAAVPEPSTFALLGIAGLVGGFVAWRRRRRA